MGLQRAIRIGHVVGVVSFWIISFLPQGLQGQGTQPSRQAAMEAFSAKDYSRALENFRGLTLQFPSDPLYMYYSGICLVELSREPGEAARLLQLAIRGSSAVRNVPADAWFYLGRAHQMEGRFDEAIRDFDSYGENARRKEVKDKGTDRYIEECRAGIGALAVSQPAVRQGEPADQVVSPEKEKLPVVEVAKADSSLEAKVDVKQEERAGQAEPAIKEYSEYDIIAREALEWQFRADSVSSLAERYRGNLRNLTGADREAISRKILELEGLGFEYQSMADKKFSEASKLSMAIAGEVVSATDETPGKDDEVPKEEIGVIDNLVVAATDSIPEERDEEKLPEAEPVPEPVYSIFDADFVQPDAIEVNPEIPEGLYYRIQVAAFRNPVSPGYFKKLGPVYGFKADDSDITFFFIGLFRRLEDAGRALDRVRAAGFKDAFTVAIADGKRVSMERAALLENEWKNVSLLKGSFSTALKAVKAEPAEPPTLMYRVEVAKVKKALAPAEVDKIKTIAGNRKFDIVRSADNLYVYLIGNFITFESAGSYSDLIYRNGLKDAKVVAYLGTREIPLETAKQLFEMYFNK